MDLSARLNELRMKHSLTYQQISDMSNVPIGTVKSIFTGTSANPGFESVAAIVTAMGEDLHEFYTGQEKPIVSSENPQPIVHLAPIQLDLQEIGKSAIESVYREAGYKHLLHSERTWCIVALVLMTFIIGILIFDITHPTMGYIQYTA